SRRHGGGASLCFQRLCRAYPLGVDKARCGGEVTRMMTVDSSAGAAVDKGRGQERLGPWEPGKYVLRDAWFPVAHSQAIRRDPARRFVHGQPFYLWRQGERLRAAECHPAELKARRGEASAFTTGG